MRAAMKLRLFLVATGEAPHAASGLDLLATAVLMLDATARSSTRIRPPRTCSSCRGRSSSASALTRVFGECPALVRAIGKRDAIRGASYTEQELELGVVGKPRLHLTCTVSPIDTR